MPNIVVVLNPDDYLLINGARIKAIAPPENKYRKGPVSSYKSRLVVLDSDNSRFLFGKQILEKEQVQTPLQELYYALQNAYVAKSEDADKWLAQAEQLSRDMKSDTASLAMAYTKASKPRYALVSIEKAIQQGQSR